MLPNPARKLCHHLTSNKMYNLKYNANRNYVVTPQTVRSVSTKTQHPQPYRWRTKTLLVFRFYMLPTSVLDNSEWFFTEGQMTEEGTICVRKVTGITITHCGIACQGLAGVGAGDRETNAHVLLMDYVLHGQQNKKWGFKDLGGRKRSNGRLGKMEQNKGEKPIYLKWKTAQSNGCGMINSAVMVWLWTLGPKHLTWFGRKALADVNYNVLT